MFTVESVERFARDREFSGRPDCHVLLIADENVENEDAALRDVATYQEFGTAWGWRPVSVEHVVDTIHFVDSRTNWAIQVADCVAYLANRRRRVLASDDPSQAAEAVRQLWDTYVSPQVWDYNIWQP